MKPWNILLVYDEAHDSDNLEKDAEINFTSISIEVNFGDKNINVIVILPQLLYAFQARVMQGGVLTECTYLGFGVCRHCQTH